MDEEYTFSPKLLRMMLSEERQKFVAALGQGTSWKELNRIRETIHRLNKLLDSSNNTNRTDPASSRRHNDDGPR